MKITARINARYFALAMLFQSREPTRYYLNGVFVEPHPEGGVTMVATDGHRLGAFRDKDGHIDKPRIIQMPKTFRAPALKPTSPWLALFESPTTRGCQAHLFDATGISDEPESVEEMIGDVTYERVKWIGAAAYIDGTYPDWRKAIPTMPEEPSPVPVIDVDGRQLADFQEVATRTSCSGVSLIPSVKGSPIIVQCGDDSFFGIVMPRRDSTTFERAVLPWVLKRADAAYDLVGDQNAA